MTRIKNHTSNVLKEHLVKYFTEKRFCVLDLHGFAIDRGIPIKTLTYLCWWLCDQKFLEKCGGITRPEGGRPMNVYKIAEKSVEDFEHVDMKTASLNLAAIFR